jgi:hypothetical protein
MWGSSRMPVSSTFSQRFSFFQLIYHPVKK